MDTSFPNSDISVYDKAGMQPFVNRRPRKPSVVHWRTDSMPTSTSASNSNTTSMDLDGTEGLSRLSKYPRSSSSSHMEAPLAYDDSYFQSNRRTLKEKEIEKGFRDNEKGPYAYVYTVPPTPLPELSQDEVYRIVGIENNENNNVSSSSVSNPWRNKLIRKKEEATQVEGEPELEPDIPVGEKYKISRPYPLGHRPTRPYTDIKEKSAPKGSVARGESQIQRK